MQADAPVVRVVGFAPLSLTVGGVGELTPHLFEMWAPSKFFAGSG